MCYVVTRVLYYPLVCLLSTGVLYYHPVCLLSPVCYVIARVLSHHPRVISSPVVLYGMHLGGGGGVGVVVDHVKCWYRLRCYLWGWVGVWTESGVGGFGVWMLVAALLLV